MKYSKKTILIKLTSSTGKSMVHNAEYHTLFYFCKWLIKDNNIVLSGIESESQLVKELNSLGVIVRKPFFRYLSLKRLKFFLHIPISLLNTFIDSLIVKPDLMICLGGVFYNGLGIVITGKLLKIKTLVRSAEDHIGLARSEKFNFLKIYAIFRSFLSRYAIQNSDYFLTVGNWSLNYFRDIYGLGHGTSFMVPGPLDYSICNQNYKKTNITNIRNQLIKDKNLSKESKLILFIGSNIFKGINSTFNLAEKIKKEGLSANIIWISNSERIRRTIIERGLSKNVYLINPMDRKKLTLLLKNVDFLFWSTPLGVGYGQIMLESILCDTEILCFNPKGDAKELVKSNFYKSIEEIIQRIKGQIKAKKFNIPKSMNNKILEKKHRQLINKILS